MELTTTRRPAARRGRKPGLREMPVDSQGRAIVNPYLRMSDGFDGKQDNKENQLDDVSWVYDEQSWSMGRVLCDEVSAWQRGVVREDFEELLLMIENGQSAGVVFYNQDRLLRQPKDLERIFDLWADGRPWLKIASADRVFDINDPDTRSFMRGNANNAVAQSDATSRRARRKNTGKRARGVLVGGGPRPFAWPGKEPKQPGDTERRPVSEERLEAERELLRKAYDDVLKGKPLSTVADEWNAAGLLSFYGNPWDGVTVRNTMSRGRYAGRIEHEGEVVNDIANHEPLIDGATFDQVQMKFASRRRGAPISERFLGTGIVCCSICKQTVQSRPRYPGGDSSRKDDAIPTSRCIKRANTLRCGGVQIDQVYVEAFCRGLVIERLSDPDVAQAASELVMEADIRGIEVTAELETAIATRESLLEKVMLGEIPQASFDKHSPKLAERIRVLQAKAAQLTAVAADQQRVRAESEVAVAARWDAADMAGKRSMLQAATRLVRVEILPAGAGRRRLPPEERFRVVPL